MRLLPDAAKVHVVGTRLSGRPQDKLGVTGRGGHGSGSFRHRGANCSSGSFVQIADEAG